MSVTRDAHLDSHVRAPFPLADSVVAHTAQQFLVDSEAFAWARRSLALLHAMRAYRIRRMVPLLVLLRRSEGCALLPALEVLLEDMQNPECWDWKPEGRARLCTLTMAAISSPIPLDNTERYSSEIGKVESLCLDHGLAEDIFGRMHLLPSTIHTVRLSFSLRGLDRIHLSRYVKTLEVDSIRDESLQDIHLPDPGLHELLFDDSSEFNGPLDRLRLPSSLHTLRLGCCFDQPVEHLCLPSSLTDLTLGTGQLNQSGAFNQPVDGLCLSEGLKFLRFSQCFNQRMDRLKATITVAIFKDGEGFQPTSAAVGSARITLVMSTNWRLPADQLHLPPALQQLIFPSFSAFNHPIANGLLHLPATLLILDLGSRFNQSLRSITFPSSLTSLRLPGAFSHPLGLLDWTPPPALQELELGFHWNHPFSQLSLPPSLTSLTIRYAINQPPQDCEWPPSLRTLSLNVTRWSQPNECLPRNLPQSLQVLELWGADERTSLWIGLSLPPDCELCDDRGMSLILSSPSTPCEEKDVE